MARDPTGGVQTLPDIFATNLSTLASLTALQISDDYAGTNLKKDFLLKTLRCSYMSKVMEADETVLVGFARGDMTVAEIATALGNFLADPESFQQWDNFVIALGIFWQTIRIVSGNAVSGTPVAAMKGINEDIQIGGGKGIPLEAGAGIQMFVFNPSGGALTTGAQVQGLYSLVGVFLKDSQA